jgi:hypothetical protein
LPLFPCFLNEIWKRDKEDLNVFEFRENIQLIQWRTSKQVFLALCLWLETLNLNKRNDSIEKHETSDLSVKCKRMDFWYNL